MEISQFNYQRNTSNYFTLYTFYKEEEKQRSKQSNFSNKVLINFRNGDFTSIFTLFGKSFNYSKHTSLIPINKGWEELKKSIQQNSIQLPQDFKWVAIPELKWNGITKTWRLHFHLISNYPLLFETYGENKLIDNIDYLANSYLTKSFQLLQNGINNIQFSLFSDNCKDFVLEKISKNHSYYNLYSLIKNIAKNKGKDKQKNIYWFNHSFLDFPNCRSP